MGTGLVQTIEQYVAKEKGAVAKLAAVVGKDTQTVKRWLKNGRIPGTHDRYLVARQCGRSEDEAISLAHEKPPEDARESA